MAPIEQAQPAITQAAPAQISLQQLGCHFQQTIAVRFLRKVAS